MFTFEVFQKEHIPLMRRWLNADHVKPYWQEKENDEELAQKYLNEFPKRNVFPFVIVLNGSPVGYIQYYNAYRIGNGWWETEPPGTFGIDLLIGSGNFIGKGHGSKIIQEFVTFVIGKEPTLQTIIIDPDPANTRAIRSFEKAGFVSEAEIQTPGGAALLMRLKVTTDPVFDSQPTLTGDLILLRPLKADDFEELYACASDPKIWEIHPQKNRYQREIFQSFFDGAMQSKGAFAVTDRVTGKIIGSSRFYNIDFPARSLAIGYTFLATSYWGGKYNYEMKKLMMSHAMKNFDRVFFEIGVSNFRSRKAIEKFGAKLVKSEELDGRPHVVYEITREQFEIAFRT